MDGERPYAKTMRIDLLLNASTAGTPIPSDTDSIKPLNTTEISGDFEILLHSLYDAALLTTFDGVVITANARALRFFGYDVDGIRSQCVGDLIAGADASVLETVIENVQSDRFTLLQAYAVRSDGTVFPAEISVTQLTLASCICLCFFVRDISTRRTVEDQLRIEGEAIRNAGNGIAITDPDGFIDFANPALNTLWGYDSPDALTDTPVQALFPDADRIGEAIGKTIRTGTWSGELEARARNGRSIFVQVAITSCVDADDCLTNLVFSFADITKRRHDEQELIRYQDHLEEMISERTADLRHANAELSKEIAERKRVEGELRAAMRKLREHDEAKSEFVSNVSHELRTPLTSLIHAVENLMRGTGGSVSDPVYSYLTMMLEDCWRLDRTINDILDLSRIETGKFALSTRQIPFVRMIERTAEAIRLVAEGIPLRFTVEHGSAFGFVECDAAKMERVLTNVISNAIKFTPADGSITIRTEHCRLNDHDGICCAITDNGVGIPAEFVARVTERFFRVGEQVGGTGLGLAIAREIVERHHGRIEIFSPPPGRERGTEVRLSLPLVPPHRILVATGDASVCRALCPLLRERGYETECVEAGRRAVQLLRDGKHRIAIINATLTDIEGIEAVMHIKADATLRHILTFFIADTPPDAVKQRILDGFNVPVLHRQADAHPLVTAIEDTFLPSPGGRAPIR